MVRILNCQYKSGVLREICKHFFEHKCAFLNADDADFYDARDTYFYFPSENNWSNIVGIIKIRRISVQKNMASAEKSQFARIIYSF